MSMNDSKHLFPHNHKRPYQVEASRSDGERELARLATHSHVEYAWEYDDTQNMWRYEPSAQFTKKRRTFGIGILWELSLGLNLPESLCSPSGDNSSFYHIHPHYIAHKLRRRKTAASFSVQAQMPSTEDVKTSLILMRDGFKDSRIVTPIGTTALTIDPDKAWESGKFSVTLPKVSFDVVDLTLRVEQSGFDATLDYVFNEMNTAYQGLLKVSFEALPDVV